MPRSQGRDTARRELVKKSPKPDKMSEQERDTERHAVVTLMSPDNDESQTASKLMTDDAARTWTEDFKTRF